MNYEWLEACVQAGEFLYGAFPITVLRKMYRRKENASVLEIEEGVKSLNIGMHLTGKGYRSWIEPMIFNSPGIVKQLKDLEAKGNPYANLHYDENELAYLKEEQRQVPEIFQLLKKSNS